MKVNNKSYRSLWPKINDINTLQIFDQRDLPHQITILDLKTVEDITCAIAEMKTRGAPIIGAVAAYGMYFAVKEALEANDFFKSLKEYAVCLKKTRPTAVNLQWAIDRQLSKQTKDLTNEQRLETAYNEAMEIADEDAKACEAIGEFGLDIIKSISENKNNEVVNILTHCNAGWLATVDWGSATAPIYKAHNAGIKVHVWVDETRPRGQGSRLTAWELLQHGVPHTVISDNTGGHLMQHGMVDICLVGSDRVTNSGDVANKIGTYLKALAAYDNGVPFYVAFPSSTIDWTISDGLKQIPIEIRGEEEVKYARGMHEGEIKEVLIAPGDSPAVNYGFDVTPAKYITGLLTEYGLCPATTLGLAKLIPQG